MILILEEFHAEVSVDTDGVNSKLDLCIRNERAERL